ncbi:hypothetical protein JOM56_004556 [Amanita muscaria]
MKLEKWGPRVFLSDNFSHSHTQNVLSRRSVKRRRVATNPFVDHEAAVTWSDAEEEGEEGEEGEDLVDALEENSEDSEGAQDFTSIHNAVGAPVTRLEAAIAPVISRIECGALRRTQNEDPAMPENALGPDPFLDNIIRMPAARDPPMWRVRVHESDQTHALWVIHDRLEKTPHLAISASSSPHNRGWIAIESTSIAAVEKLCQTVSAIPQPPRIEFVSPDERIECLRVPNNRPHTDCPGWARVKSRAVLHQLGVDERLAKFSKDLVLVHNAASYPLVDLFVIPRLPVRLGPSSKKTRVPRLLLPLLFQQVYQKTYADLYPRNIFWYPDKAGLVLEKQTGGIAQLRGLRVTESFLPPFCVFCDIPIEALNFNIKATYSELQIFSEGFESVSNHSFKMTVSTKEFMQLSWEKHVRAPLEVGHRIRASIQQQQIEATVVEVSYNHVVVNDNASTVQYTLPSDEAKRIFITGDTVKVYVSPSYHGRQGWVLCVQDEDVTVVDVETKTDVTHFTVKSWQLVPFEFDLTYCSDVIQSSPLPVIREYNHFNGLVNQQVLIVGQNSDKGLRGRIKQHLVGHVVRVELESGSRMVDLHVNSLVATTRSGPRLRDYYDENHRTIPAPITDLVVSELPPTCTRALTPLPFEIGDEIDVWHPRCPTPMIENEDDAGDPHTSTPQPNSIGNDEPPICFDSRVLAYNWLMNSGLVSARIRVRVANSNPSHLSAGFVNGTLEGKKGMIMSAASPDAVKVQMAVSRSSSEIEIPLRFLCPDLPTGKGQTVVVIEGAHAGRIFITRAKDDKGDFPLAVRNYRGTAPLTLGASSLARCDAS